MSQGEQSRYLEAKPTLFAMATQIVLDNGVFLPQLNLWLDARRRQPVSVVSHTQTDHWTRHERLIGATATLALVNLRWPLYIGACVLPELGEALRDDPALQTIALWKADTWGPRGR
ncbi:MAG: hypothetical protein WBB22_15480 [Anaerolineae bacterium]